MASARPRSRRARAQARRGPPRDSRGSIAPRARRLRPRHGRRLHATRSVAAVVLARDDRREHLALLAGQPGGADDPFVQLHPAPQHARPQLIASTMSKTLSARPTAASYSSLRTPPRPSTSVMRRWATLLILAGRATPGKRARLPGPSFPSTCAGPPGRDEPAGRDAAEHVLAGLACVAEDDEQPMPAVAACRRHGSSSAWRTGRHRRGPRVSRTGRTGRVRIEKRARTEFPLHVTRKRTEIVCVEPVTTTGYRLAVDEQPVRQ